MGIPHSLTRLATACVLLTANPAWLFGAPAAPLPATTALTDSARAPVSTRTLTVRTLGHYNGIQFRGLDSTAHLNQGIRLDERVMDAQLVLRLAYSPSLIGRLSQLKIKVNGIFAGAIELDKERAGVEHERTVRLDPTLFSDYNDIELEFIGHYSENCEDPAHSSLWMDISPASALKLSVAPISLTNDLSIVPAPFFDKRDTGPVKLSLVLPVSPSLGVLKAAATVSSWIGALASYRPVSVEVLHQTPADRHSIRLSVDGAQNNGVRIDPVNERGVKQLTLFGKTEQALLQTAQALVLQSPVLTGRAAGVDKVELGPERGLYDAPSFVPTHRPVRLAELVKDTNQLNVRGYTPDPIRIPIRVPADLFAWAGKSIPLNLSYRHTPPAGWNDSTLNVEINGGLVHSFRLRPQDAKAEPGMIGLALDGQEQGSASDQLRIPAFRVGGNNELSFRFNMPAQKSGPCASAAVKSTQASIDPESTIDFSELPHYLLMPNLAAFANAGFPFTKRADMSDTVALLPAHPDDAVSAAFLTTAAQLGRWTGLPALRLEVGDSAQSKTFANKHWLVFGTRQNNEWLDAYEQSLPMVLAKARRSINAIEPGLWIKRWWREDLSFAPTSLGRALIQSDGPLSAIVGFQSPLNPDRSVVTFTAETPTDVQKLAESLNDPAVLPRIVGAVTLFKGQDVEGFDWGKTYVEGYLPWHLRIRILLSQHPLLVGVIGALAGLAFSLWAYGWLGRRARKRLGG